jgi:hypothetical protein
MTEILGMPRQFKRAFPLLIGLVLLAGFLAMTNGIQTRSLLLDEALFVRNLTQFPGGYYISMAPSAPLFYGASYGLMALFGKSEWVFRLIPLLCAVTGIILLSLHLVRNFSRPVAAASVFLLATSLPLVYFAKNAHPYTADFLCSVFLLLLTEALIRSFSRRTFVLWLGVCAVSVVFSFPSLFVVLCSAAALGFSIVMKKDRAVLRSSLPGFAALAVTVLLLVVFIYGRQSSDRDLAYWAGGFPQSSHPLVLAKFAFEKTGALLGFLFFNGTGGLAGLFLVVTGGAWFVRTKKTLFALFCAGPAFFTLIASFAHKWPYGPVRTVLFLSPFFIVLIAAGLEWVWKAASNRAQKILVACAMVLLLLPQGWVLKQAFVPAGDSEEAVKTLSAAMKSQIADQDRFLVYYAAEVQFRFYFPEYTGRSVFQPWSDRGNRDALASFVRKNVEGKAGRFWLVFSHVEDKEDSCMASTAGKFGSLISSHSFPGCSAVLFETGAGAR